MRSKKTSVFTVILSGGQSSRLFPFNKVLCDLSGARKTLIQQAYQRAKRLSGGNHIHILTVPAMAPLMRKQIPVPASRFLSDPARRGTWPALLWAMAHLRQKAEDPVLAVLTGDHVIPKELAFQRLAEKAIAAAQRKPSIVLLGVQPSNELSTWSGFGCFRVAPGGAVTAFEEKPSADRAKAMLCEGGWFWNSGMFFFRVSAAEEALERFQPTQYAIYRRLVENVARKDKDAAVQTYQEFPARIPHPRQTGVGVDNTIDYAILMPLVASSQGLVEALAVESPIPSWFDIGRWDALKALLPANRAGTIHLGRVRAGNSVKRSIVAADKGSRIEVEGIEDYLVACSRGRALVMPLAQLEEIKNLVAASAEPVVRVGADHLDIQFQKNRLIVRPKR